MCGIAGYIGQGDQKILKNMTDMIKYRGPDDEGFHTEEGIGLGMRRLSIIDLIGGKQPIYNEDKSVVAVFNGEIYNFQEIKKELIAVGHKFETNSDTEIIVHQYEESGENCFKKFNGMFAIALWDKKEKKLILARDRYGEKPLYWSKINDTLIFSSEIKSILSHPLIEKKLNHLAIYQYFSFDYVPQPLTVFENIYKLENGSSLVFKNNEIKINRFYEIKSNEEKIDFKSALVKLEKLLEDSVKRRLIADVPLGVFLSGGIDSSTIAYFAKKHQSQIKTFSIGFSEKTFDESIYAKQVAKLLNTEHYHKEFGPNDLLKIIPEIIDKLDEPFGDSSILPTFLLSKFTKEKVTVVLGGDGGDELLMGYPNHQIQKLLYFLKLHNLKFNGDLVSFLERILPVSNKNLRLSYKMKRYCHGLSFPGLYRDFLNIGGYIRDLNNLFKFQIDSKKIFSFVDNFLGNQPEKNYLKKINLLFLKYYLEDDILFKVDRAGMYNSLEVRAPFLDFNLADLLNSLPLNYKLRGQRTKYILKKLMAGRLPKHIINRKKKGFGIPLTIWLKRDLKNYMLETLNRKDIDDFGIINYDFVEKLINEHLQNKKDNRKILWNLIIFQNWCKNYL
ncbi:MAG TPA: asparagine synthase (glutamine-hydrolyzing) [Candidatus Portnoybacteria bacterium]|nr:asparagine synthase (glutamine-hydrolyzing) [Candidatus Portnoybacteria bacterium]